MSENQPHSDAHGGHGDVAVEETSLSNGGIMAMMTLTAVVFFGSAGVLFSVLNRMGSELMDQKASVDSQELKQIRAQEEERLTTYGYVDKEKQVVRIPIDVAMQKVVEDAKK